MPSSIQPRNIVSPDAINLTAVARAVLRKIPAVLMFSSLFGAATGGVLATMAPKYLSQAQLEVRGGGAPETGGRPDKEAVGTHVRGLMSTELALKMSAALHLTSMPEFNSALEPADLFGRTLRRFGLSGIKAGENDEDRLMQAYFQNVRAYQVRDTRSIIVDCTTSNAKFSAECANTLASLYRDSLRGRDVRANADLRVKLKPQVERLSREAAEAEALVGAFRGRANLFTGGDPTMQLKGRQLADLTAELTRVANTRSEAEARAGAARDMAQRGIAAANPDVQKSTLIANMEEQRVGLERQIAELSATLLAGHPRMKQLHAELRDLKAQIRAEITRVVDSLGNDARIAADREAAVRRRVDELKRTVVSSAPDSAKLAQLENAAKSKRAELERLQVQYEKAASSAGAGADAVEIEIVSRAYPSNEKVFPKIGTMAAISTFAVALLGFVMMLTRELVRGARPTAAATPAAITATMDAEIVDKAAVALQLLSADTAADALVAAAVAAGDAGGTHGFRIIMAAVAPVSETAPTALALGRRLASQGYCAVVVAWVGAGDALSSASGLAPAPGTAQLLAGTASLEQAVQRLPGSTLDVVSSGHGARRAADADGAAMLLDALDEMYDFVIVDATNADAAALFASLQGRFDGGVLVSTTPVSPLRHGQPVPFLGYLVADFMVLSVTPVAAPARGQRTGMRNCSNASPAQRTNVRAMSSG